MLSDSESNQNASSSQSTISRSDMNNKSIDKKKDFTEEYFDSGVISDVIVSSEFSSEDVKPSVSASHISSVDLSHGIRKEVRSVMISDSGIDIESFSSEHISSRRGSLKYESAESGDTKKHILPGSTYTVEELFAQDKDGDTQLHNAIVEGCEEVVKKLIYLVPNSRFLDIQNSDLQTCLHLSVLTKQPEITRLLLLAGAQTGLEDRNGNTALHLACEGNDIACVKALLCPIFEQNWDDFKYTPQIDSPKNYINKINYEGLSCAHIAANRKHYIILHILLMNEADVNIRERKAGYTLLHEAVASGNTELVRYILQHPRINIEAQNYALYTAYQLSLMYPIISNLLLSKNAQKLKFAYEESDDEYSSDDEDDYESNDDVLDEKINALNLNHASLVC